MNILIKLIANAVVATFDFCFGMLIGMAILTAFHFEVTLLDLFISGILALLPDIDLVSLLIPTTKKKDYHRSFGHYPLISLPLGFIIGFEMGGYAWALIVTACLIAHYLHDMAGMLGGLVVFYPFSSDFYNFKGRYQKGKAPREWYIPKAGHYGWLREFWLSPSHSAVAELILSVLLAIVIIIFDLRYWYVLALPACSWIAIIWCWERTKKAPL